MIHERSYIAERYQRRRITATTQSWGFGTHTHIVAEASIIGTSIVCMCSLNRGASLKSATTTYDIFGPIPTTIQLNSFLSLVNCLSTSWAFQLCPTISLTNSQSTTIMHVCIHILIYTSYVQKHIFTFNI